MLGSIIDKFQSTIDKLGQKGMPKAFSKKVFHKIKYFLKRFYFKSIIQNKILARIFSFKKPVVLLYGYARSGTSWTGNVISLSSDIAYLREPITQTFLQKLNYKTPFFKASNKNVRKNFNKIAHQSFNGIPPISFVMQNRSDFFYFFNRNKRSLLIKEVIDLKAYRHMINHFSPKTILLLRHPAAVADSFFRMGWLNHGDSEEFGFRYGTTMLKAKKIVSNVNHKIQCYEDLAKNPRKEFSELFEFMNVTKPADFDTVIEEYCEQEVSEYHPYNTKRTSQQQATKWKHNLDKETIESIKMGYMRTSLDYYREEHYWEI